MTVLVLPRQVRVLTAGTVGLVTLALATSAVAAPVGPSRTAVAAPSAAPAASASAGAARIDSGDLNAVNGAYLAEFQRTGPGSGFNGNPAACNQGSTSDAWRSSQLQRINYYRSMVGVAALAENGTADAVAQKRATLMAANNDLSHNVPTTWRCASTLGSGASGYGENLYYGVNGTAAVDGYMADDGVSNAGHRINITSAGYGAVGMGDVDGSSLTNALEFAGGGSGASSGPGGGVAWPSQEYFPRPLFTSPGMQWSYVLAGDCSNATVQMTRNGAPIPVTLGNRNNFGCNVVWTPQVGSIDAGATYGVTVSGIVNQGRSVTVSYNVKPFDPSPCLVGSPASSPGVDVPEVFRDGIWYQRNTYTSGPSVGCFQFGQRGDVAVTGDWDGNGSRTSGIFRAGVWYLSNSANPSGADVVVRFGSPGDVPIVGRWRQNGPTLLGLFRPSTGQWFLRASLTSGPADNSWSWASPGDQPVVGDWNGDGTDTVGVFRPSTGQWFLQNSFGTTRVDVAFGYGSPGDVPVAGDWNNDGVSTPAVFRGGVWYLSNGFGTPAVGSFAFGAPGDQPEIWR